MYNDYPCVALACLLIATFIQGKGGPGLAALYLLVLLRSRRRDIATLVCGYHHDTGGRSFLRAFLAYHRDERRQRPVLRALTRRIA